MQTLSINRPDDWHVHLRDQHALSDTTAATASHFGRALVMPNLVPPLVDVQSINAYRQRIINAASHTKFTPYMTLYLNEQVSPETLIEAAQHPYILGAKLYPAGATTNSQAGAKSIRSLYPLFEVMQQHHLVLQIHGEETCGDIFEREHLFIETHLKSLVRDFPNLRIVLEHISTQQAVDFILQAPSTVAATITPHHLFYQRNHLLAGGIKPHFYCLPILKKASDQKALQQAAISGSPKFFAGTDSAPHAQHQKENACGCAGIYSAPYAVSFYAHIFDECGQLDRLNAFMGHFGATFYQLPVNQEQIILVKKKQQIPHHLPLGKTQVVPMHAGQSVDWSVL